MKTTLPASFVEQMGTILGEEIDDFIEAMNEEPPVSIRIHPIKKFELALLNEKIPWADNGYYLNERPLFTIDPVFHAGGYYVQEASSMFLEYLLKENIEDFSKPFRILDLCAAPGGKTTHIASLFGNNSLIIANEINQKRYQVLKQNIGKWGMANIWTTNLTTEAFKNLEGFFDLILIDAPCSGEGMMRKDEFARTQWSPQLIEECASMQKDIVHSAAQLLKEDGLLLYSTCTFNPTENIERADQFNSLELKPITTTIPDFKVVRNEKNGFTGYQMFPHRIKGEGFFVCGAMKSEARNFNYGKVKKSFADYWTKHKDNKLFDRYLNSDDFVYTMNKKEEHFAFPLEFEKDWNYLSSVLPKIEPSLKLGHIKGKDVVPHAHLAWSTAISNEIPHYELDIENAREYLRRNPIFLDNAAKNWNIARYKGLNLGWFKNLGNRWNNYYPIEHKIIHW